MQKIAKLAAGFLSVLIVATPTGASPWFTGPILAPAGRTIPRGHTNVEFYGLSTNSRGRFTDSGQRVRTPLYQSVVANPVVAHGFTDWLDVQLVVPYVFNSTLGKHHNGISDTSVGLGFQLLEQKESKIKPNLRFVIQENIPTGRFDQLNPELSGTDATGLGSYQTIVAFNFQHLAQVFNTHYLRTRLSLSRVNASAVTINGLSSYGGTINTHGTISPGFENDVTLAFEYTLTQNWVAVMEGYISQGNATRFNGSLGVRTIDNPAAAVGSGSFYEEALTPALEYNFSERVGVIGGVWFPIKGQNTGDYMTYVVALNAFW
jgi:hypothetical protein